MRPLDVNRPYSAQQGIPVGYPIQSHQPAPGQSYYANADALHYANNPPHSPYPNTYYGTQPNFSYPPISGGVTHHQPHVASNSGNGAAATTGSLASLYTGEASTQTAVGFDASVESSAILGGSS